MDVHQSAGNFSPVEAILPERSQSGELRNTIRQEVVLYARVLS
jgi:hypothetical protein